MQKNNAQRTGYRAEIVIADHNELSHLSILYAADVVGMLFLFSETVAWWPGGGQGAVPPVTIF